MLDQTLLVFGLLLSVALLGVVGLFTVRHFRRKKSLRRTGLSAVRGLQQLLTLIQQHRGLSNAILHGDHSLQTAIVAVRPKVLTQIEHCEATSVWLKDDNQWREITLAWAKITADFSTFTSETSFQRHCDLIAMVLNIIVTTAQRTYLVGMRGVRQKNDLAYLWQDLLVVAEKIGQVRALGIGIAVDGYCSPDRNERLQFLLAEVINASEQLLCVIPNPEVIAANIARFVATVEERILLARPTISALDYFQIASDAIDSLYEHYQSEMRLLMAAAFR
ncbi:hypothetical protein [Halioxenophilus sp. WMMB6]|uniref:hypothetical protein n=1 Tax=Halioxenophilus sp. WMMB6 TaxID=3073815 RepID=UPI00295E9AAF|nr:hypothetical protein [Halioxenophilus sp. WMMB6]